MQTVISKIKTDMNTSSLRSLVCTLCATFALVLCLFTPTHEAKADHFEHSLKFGAAISSKDLAGFQMEYNLHYLWPYVSFGLDLTLNIGDLSDEDIESGGFSASLVTRWDALSIDPVNLALYAGPGVLFTDGDYYMDSHTLFLVKTGVELSFRIHALILGLYAGYDFGTNGNDHIHYGNFGIIFRWIKVN